MKLLPFKKSAACSVGIELEIQIINPKTYSHIARAKDLMKHINQDVQKKIKPEITQSMIEINSSVHTSLDDMEKELTGLKNLLVEIGNSLNITFCSGGTHPFQRWVTQKIYPTKRFKNLTAKYRYLSKRSAVFAQHIHIGCSSANDALYLTHALARYVPQLIAIAASSPFYQGIDTNYASSRVNVFNSFPLSGVIPYLTTWEEFSDYFYMMQDFKIIKTMKDFYWDIRPKPEFGTVEIRVCDAPLTIKKALLLAAYLQTLSCYLLQEKPIHFSRNLYYLYNYNRFEASRYGFDGEFINAETKEKMIIQNDILSTMDKIQKYAAILGTLNYLALLKEDIVNKYNDTIFLRQCYKKHASLVGVVAEQCNQWLSN